MTARKPLVINAGQIQQLQSGDDLDDAAGYSPNIVIEYTDVNLDVGTHTHDTIIIMPGIAASTGAAYIHLPSTAASPEVGYRVRVCVQPATITSLNIVAYNWDTLANSSYLYADFTYIGDDYWIVEYGNVSNTVLNAQ